ncbi:lysyl-tRNA synthetase [Sodiomyces alkalinus F11]|uniref:Lysyl-tRNA synthetase n=1 Tax=Sodiomyces alkalinus (strain CBS 110278 / VKM F-3762 / F11) TaxID=1314773 RepID=A0A3N2PYA5_SODAK|nr:lysyl-tRNA synthetase [Sodiomyces alkalinus F11]ROT39523.1 lysyl-tRNA synthetase [Sodiomyces alkalinus F11]
MIAVQYLRIWRPSIRTIRAPVTRQSLRLQQCAFSEGRRFLQDAGSASNGDAVKGGNEAAAQRKESQNDDTEFKKMRTRVLGDPSTKELYSESHPRLKTQEGRMSIPQFKKRWQPQKTPDTSKLVTLYGRIQSIRKHGNKLIFLTIVNEVETIQGMINLKMVQPMTKEAFKLFGRLIERGDHISLTGKPTRSSTGELVLEARVLPELLAPAMEPIPESLTDPETKSQKRHVDMLVNREVADTLRLKSHIMQFIRDQFVRDDFLEVQTPILAHHAGGAVARPFVTRATEFPDKELSLRVAPELWLKRLVVGGLNKVFEMGPSFRNEGIDATHNPEFTMCEFYSAYTNLDDLIRITESLLQGLAVRCDELIRDKLTSLQPIDVAKFAAPFPRVEFIPALEDSLGFRLPNLSARDALPELLAVLKLAGIPLPGGDENVPATLAKLLDRLAAVYLEPRSFERPTLIAHHPACMSPLAKSFLCPRTGQLVAARAELFVDGRELANMYEEENDPSAQARKLAEHRAMSARRPSPASSFAHAESEGEGDRAGRDDDADMDAAPLDKSYIKAMEAGLPPTGGWGCGVERLVMLFSGANRISDCLTFGTLRNVVGLTSEGPGQGAEHDRMAAQEEGTGGDQDGEKSV